MSRVLVLVIIAVATAAAADSKAPTADAIMKRVEDRDLGKDTTASHTLVVIPKDGTKRLRSYTLLRQQGKDVVKMVTFFSAPADVRGAAFLAWDGKSGDDQRWIFLPAIGQVRRLVVGDARQSFFGSDFVYEDFTNRDPELDTHKLVGSQKVDNRDCWVIESKPNKPNGLDFASYKTWVWKTHEMAVRQELYDASGKPVRRMQVPTITEIQGIQTPGQVTVTNLKTGSESRLEISNVKYNTNIASERFEEAQLQRGAP
jgi:outer membrane lipoprotein-sorting protein